MSTTGNDTTGDGTSAKPFATIQHAIDLLPKNLNQYIVKVYVAAGNYAGFSADNFYAGGQVNVNALHLIGESPDKTNIVSNGARINSCHSASLSNMHISGDAYGFNVSALNTDNFEIENCILDDAISDGLQAIKSNVYLWDNTISNKQRGIVVNGSIASITFTHGTGNSTCFNCGNSASGNSGLMIGYANNIAGTAKYLKERGGVIFDDGVMK